MFRFFFLPIVHKKIKLKGGIIFGNFIGLIWRPGVLFRNVKTVDMYHTQTKEWVDYWIGYEPNRISYCLTLHPDKYVIINETHSKETRK